MVKMRNMIRTIKLLSSFYGEFHKGLWYDGRKSGTFLLPLIGKFVIDSLDLLPYSEWRNSHFIHMIVKHGFKKLNNLFGTGVYLTS
jgi:hypothetical protein